MKAALTLKELYETLTPWQKTQVARHPQRPHFSDYVKGLITEWTPLAGDRKYAEDPAVQAGFGRYNGTLATCDAQAGRCMQFALRYEF